MNKLILISFFIINLYANDINETKSTMELFLLKLGITGLVSDFENEKKNINKNSSDIELLKNDIKYLLQQNIKNKLGMRDDVPVLNIPKEKQDSNIELKKLHNENIKLKADIKKLKQEQLVNKRSILAKKDKKIKKTIQSFQAKVAFRKKVEIRDKPYTNAKVIKYVNYEDILEIEKCTSFGWCKLKGQKAYIPRYKIKVLKVNK